MKKGDIVRCRYNFTFEAVHEDILTISIPSHKNAATTKDYIPIPLYIHGLGFYPPEFDYCLPGSYLPIVHPDYYRETKNGYFLYKGEQCKISFDPDFMFTGKYWLMPDSGAPIVKYAQLRSPELRQKRIDDAIGQVLDGIMLEGRVLDFLVREKETNELVSVINGKEFRPGHQSGDSRIFVYIQDTVTGVEFSFPVAYLTIKP